MSRLHPALEFLRDKLPAARAAGPDALVMEIDGTRLEIHVATESSAAVFFAAGETRLGYRCGSAPAAARREKLRALLLEFRDWLAAGRVAGPNDSLPAGGGWTDPLRGGDSEAWRDWAVRSYRTVVESGSRDDCKGLPDCLDLRMRPPLPPPWAELAEPPGGGACSQCARVRGCPAAHDGDGNLTPLRHADAASAELAALTQLSRAAAVPLDTVMEARSLLAGACADGALDGALPMEHSLRVGENGRGPDGVRFVSYYPMVTSDAVRREINRGRRGAVRTLAARWLTSAESKPLDDWLACTVRAQPATLGLSIGLEVGPTAVRLQVYAHPEPNESAQRFVAAATAAVGGAVEQIPPDDAAPVLVGIAVAAGRRPALKLYYRRLWENRGDTGLLPDGLGRLEPFNPGWGLAVQEHVGGRAAWVKWDFPVTTHYQDFGRFLEAFWRAGGDASAAVPNWMSGTSFAAWPTWASVGRGGRALYFLAR